MFTWKIFVVLAIALGVVESLMVYGGEAWWGDRRGGWERDTPISQIFRRI